MAEAARRCRVNRSSVHRWLAQYRAEHEATALIDRPRSGRPRLHRPLTPRGWRRPWHATRAAAAIRPRAGRCRCWRTIWPRRASRSARGPCDAGCTRQVIAGSARATSMSRARLIWRRKKGHHPPSEGGLAQGRSAAVPRLDAVAAVSTAAGDLGAHGHSGARADHRPQREAGAVWGHRPAKRAPGGADPPPRRSGRRAGVPAHAAAPLPLCRLALLLTDRASAHTAPQTQALAARLRIRFVWLPRQAPELSPMTSSGATSSG